MNPQRAKEHRSRSAPGRQSKSPVQEGRNELNLDEAAEAQERLLDQIARGAKTCREMVEALRKCPAPELETIIQLHRVLVLKLSAEAEVVPGALQLVSGLMKPVMDWARLEEKRKERELAEQKLREQAAARLAAKEKSQSGKNPALKPETIEKIEQELGLL
jgi:hypothetical protein